MEASAATNYDYVIVGAGTAGCVLAGRLAEERSARVCVRLVAATGIRSSAPRAMVAAAIATPRLNWRFETVPQAHLNGRRIPQPGAGCRRSWSINGMGAYSWKARLRRLGG